MGHITQSYLLLTHLAILAIAPCSCSHIEETPVLHRSDYTCKTKSTVSICGAGVSSYVIGKIMIFIYNDDNLGLLDSSQESLLGDKPIEIESRAGRKRIVAIANMDRNRLSYNNYSCYFNLRNHICNLENENPAHPLMTGESIFEAGTDDFVSIALSPALVKISVEMLEYDFSANDYKDLEMTDMKVYLTNVNSCTSLLEGGISGSSIINFWQYDPYATAQLRHPEMLYSRYSGGTPRFYCYENAAATPDKNICRLVVEGNIGGHTYYYPIPIADGKPKRGCEYTYMILITRCGTLDPNINADDSMIKVNLKIDGWNEYENENIYYSALESVLVQ